MIPFLVPLSLCHPPIQLASSSSSDFNTSFFLNVTVNPINADPLPEKRSVLEETLQSLSTYLSSTLLVRDSTAFNLDIRYGAGDSLPGTPASGKRPIAGTIYVDPSDIPSKSQSFDSPDDRKFFEVLLRRIFSLIGLRQGFLDQWATDGWDPNSPKVISEYYPPYQREFRWLATPAIHNFTGDRFGLDSAPPSAWPFANKTYGAELAPCDNGNCDFFWSDRVFFTEIMAERYWGYARISLLTFTALEDTGWYQINRTNSSLFEPLEWGDYRSLGLSGPLSTFPAGQPDLPGNWPSHYLVRDHADLSNDFGCTYDHRAIGRVKGTARPSCNTSDALFCKWRNFTDSQGIGWYESFLGDNARSPSDFALVRRPSTICRSASTSEFARYGGTGGTNEYGQSSFCATSTLVDENYNADDKEKQICYRMDCDNESQLYILIDKEAGVCREAGQLLQFPGYSGYVVCPSPRVICGIDRYGEPYNEPATVLAQPTESPTPAITSPTDGFSLFVFYTLSYIQTRYFKGFTHLETQTEAWMETFTEVNGVWRWTMKLGGKFNGSVSVWSEAWSLSQISWLQVIPSKPYEGRYGINSAGWAGIVIAGVLLLAFVLGIVICSRRADQAWLIQQRRFAAQEKMAQRRSQRASRRGTTKKSGRA